VEIGSNLDWTMGSSSNSELVTADTREREGDFVRRRRESWPLNAKCV